MLYAVLGLCFQASYNSLNDYEIVYFIYYQFVISNIKSIIIIVVSFSDVLSLFMGTVKKFDG